MIKKECVPSKTYLLTFEKPHKLHNHVHNMDMDQDKCAVQKLVRRAHHVSCMRALPGRKMASAYDDGMICIWDLSTGTVVMDLLQHGGAPTAFLLELPHEQLAAGTRTGLISVWDLTTGALVHTIIGERAPIVSSMIVLPDGSIAVGYYTGKIIIWKLGDERNEPVTYTVVDDSVIGLAVLPDGKLASLCNTHIRVWDEKSTVCIHSFEDDNRPNVSGLYWFTATPDGLLVYASKMGLLVFDGTKIVFSLGCVVQDCAILRDGRIAFASGDSVFALDTATNSKTVLASQPGKRVYHFAELTGGYVACICSDGMVCVRDAEHAEKAFYGTPPVAVQGDRLAYVSSGNVIALI